MNFRNVGSDVSSVEVNLTPLIDVVFLLLIFFMVSTSFIRESQIEITLPEADQAAADQVANVVEVAIDGNNRVFVDDAQILDNDVAAVQAAIAAAMAGMQAPTVVVNADGNAAWQIVLNVSDAASRLGLEAVKASIRQRSSP